MKPTLLINLICKMSIVKSGYVISATHTIENLKTICLSFSVLVSLFLCICFCEFVLFFPPSLSESLTHLLVVCILVNSTCMIISWLSQSSQRCLGPICQMVLGHKVASVPATSHHYDIITLIGKPSECF